MKALDYYKDVGILIGSRAFGGRIGMTTDWDIIIKAEDLPLHIDSYKNPYDELAEGVVDMFYTNTTQGLLNIQVVESHSVFAKFKRAQEIMDKAGKVFEKDKRIDNWRLSMALAGIQKYKPWPKPSFMTKLKELFK